VSKNSNNVSVVSVVLVAGCIVTGISLGVRATMGVYLDPITSDLGVGSGSFGLAIAIQNIVWGFGQPIAGGLADRFGTARVLVAGAILYAFGLLVAKEAESVAALNLGLGLLMGLGLAGLSFSVILAAIGRSVSDNKRALAMATVTACGSLGQFVMVPLSQLLIDSIGWRQSLITGIVLVCVAGVTARPLRSSGSAIDNDDNEPFTIVLKNAFGHRSYLLLLAGFFVCGFHVTFIGVHLPKYLEDVGQTTQIAALALATIGLFNIGGTIAIGALSGTYGNTGLLSTLYLVRGIIFGLIAILPMSPVLALASAAVIGIVWLSTVPLTSAIVLKQFGPTNAGTLFGFVFLSHQLGAFIGTYGAGLVRDAAGSYQLFWWVSSALGFGAALIHLYIDESPFQKVGDSGETADAAPS